MGDEQQRALWLAVRQGLLLIVSAIERAYDLQPARRECAKLSATE